MWFFEYTRDTYRVLTFWSWGKRKIRYDVWICTVRPNNVTVTLCDNLGATVPLQYPRATRQYLNARSSGNGEHWEFQQCGGITCIHMTETHVMQRKKWKLAIDWIRWVTSVSRSSDTQASICSLQSHRGKRKARAIDRCTPNIHIKGFGLLLVDCNNHLPSAESRSSLTLLNYNNDHDTVTEWRFIAS